MQTFNINLLYLYKFMGQCLPIYAFYTLLFIERGMSVTDVAALMAFWSVFTIIFEVPSGILADRWNRRNLLAIAAALQGFCFIIWYFSHTFLLFAIGFLFWAAAAAFTSGTEEGLTYDNLKSDGCEEDFAKVYGRARLFGNAGTIAGIVSAGILASFISIGAIAVLSAVICFANVVFALHIREKNYYAERLDQKNTGFLGTLKEAAVFIKGSRLVLVCILFLVLFASLGNYLDEFDALIIHDFGIGGIWVSVILAAGFIFTALGDLLAPFVQRRISSIKQLFLLNAGACVFLTIFSILWNQYAILVFGIAFMGMAITEVLLINALQNEMQEEGRATVMSFYGIGQNVAMVCFSIVYALLAGIFSLQQVYIILSVYGIVGGIGFYLLFIAKRSKLGKS